MTSASADFPPVLFEDSCS